MRYVAGLYSFRTGVLLKSTIVDDDDLADRDSTQKKFWTPRAWLWTDGALVHSVCTIIGITMDRIALSASQPSPLCISLSRTGTRHEFMRLALKYFFIRTGAIHILPNVQFQTWVDR